MSRMRVGEWVAGAGATGLLITLFLNWFSFDRDAAVAQGRSASAVHLSGWGSLGWFMDLLLCVSIFGGLSLSYMTVKRASPAWPVGASVLTWTFGGLVFLVLAIRLAIQPGLGAGLPNGPVLVEAPAFLGLLFALVIPVGGFLSLRDERTDTAEARDYVAPPPRSVPGT